MNLFNSQGNAWTADYLKITGELDVDLRSNIAAEARAKIVYERLINFCDDAGTKDALQFLMTREITHMKAFALALESMGKPAFSVGRIAPTPGLVDQFFNDSTGTGDHGEIDTRGPWNEGGDWVFTESPAIQAGEPGPATAIVTESSPPVDEAGLGDLLLDELRDILHAEKQLTKALPKMAEAARFDQLRELFEQPAADLALIGAAQRVEHYEIAGYTTARNLASQLRHSAVVSLLSKSLAEEENADQFLNQIARSLMSVAKMPAAIEHAE